MPVLSGESSPDKTAVMRADGIAGSVVLCDMLGRRLAAEHRKALARALADADVISVAVEAAGVVADRVQVRNRMLVLIQNLGVGVDLHTANRGKDAGHQLKGVVGAFLQRKEILFRLGELLIHTLLAEAVVLLDRGLQLVGVETELRRILSTVRVKLLIDVTPDEKVEKKPYLPGEQAVDLMNRNDDVREFIKMMSLETK